MTDCQYDAVILVGMVEALDLMNNEGRLFDAARVAVTVAALERAQALASALDQLNGPDQKAQPAAA